jgi:DNA polymerase I-like protein with 3'-5' exonuclease and polymerase domains
MIVTRSNFKEVLEKLKHAPRLALDTETTGLRPYHGDRLFSLILSPSPDEAYYFNFWPSYLGVDPDQVLPRSVLKDMAPLWEDQEKLWYIHKFNYDMHILGVEGIELAGTIHCTLTQGRVQYNEHPSYTLDASLKLIGLKKDGTIEKWIKDNKAYETVLLPGKKQQQKNLFYYKVPFELIVSYGEMDAKGCYALGQHQIHNIQIQFSCFPPDTTTPLDAMKIERRIAKTVYRMEKTGVKIDRAYCNKAIDFEQGRHLSAIREFARLANTPYTDSPKLFREVFSSHKTLWVHNEPTATGQINPSFSSEVLKNV